MSAPKLGHIYALDGDVVMLIKNIGEPPSWFGLAPDGETVYYYQHVEHEPRPLVVIDPEDREQVERLWSAWKDCAPDHVLAQNNLTAALREFANPTPPKPEEPLLPEVRVRADGCEWARVGGWWVCADMGAVPRDWDYLAERDDFEIEEPLADWERDLLRGDE